MNFEEDYSYYLPVNCDLRSDVFVYFLLFNEEVVYIGQTTNGIARPLSHIKDKNFNGIKVIYCSIEELGLLEQKNIIKYDPIYNKSKYLLQRSKRLTVIHRETTIEKVKEVLIENKSVALINKTEFCEWFGVPRKYLEKWIKQGIIPYCKIGNKIMFNKKTIIETFSSVTSDKDVPGEEVERIKKEGI